MCIRDSNNVEGMPSDIAVTLASISGAHHGIPAAYFPDSRERNILILKQLSPQWHAVWQELYDITVERFGATSALQQLAEHGHTIPVAVQFLSLIHISLARGTRINLRD